MAVDDLVTKVSRRLSSLECSVLRVDDVVGEFQMHPLLLDLKPPISSLNFTPSISICW